MQDRDAQDLKRVVLSITFEILFETDNKETPLDELYFAVNEKCNAKLEPDFFKALILQSDSFEVVNSSEEPLVKLTPGKYHQIDANIAEYSIDPHIEKFLKEKKVPLEKKEKIVDILFQSIYENIYTFTPQNIQTIIPQKLANSLEQADLDLFNEFLEYNDSDKDRCLYNQFAKAIEFAILTSGKGVTQFSENIYKTKTYLLDTNIIFRLIGVGGEERQKALIQLLRFCIRQGITFEYTHHTLLELNKKLDQCVIDIKRAETGRKIEIIQEVFTHHPNLFNEDFIVQYVKLRRDGRVNSPEQYELEMKAQFKHICQELGISQVKNTVEVSEYEQKALALRLIEKRKEISEYYRYSNKQAKVDAYNILCVRRHRGANNYNYADVKSFYLTTDRGLNRILSAEQNVLVPETILPSQLFVIHNPLSAAASDEVDYKTFFRFLKRRTSEFKLRGKDVVNYITQARLYTTEPSHIVSLVEAYSDQRYKYSKSDSATETGFVSFREFSSTYFDKKHAELDSVQSQFAQIRSKSEFELADVFKSSRTFIRRVDISVAVILVPIIAICLKVFTSLNTMLIILVIFVVEISKFTISSKTSFLRKLWRKKFYRKLTRTSYYKLTSDKEYIDGGMRYFENKSDKNVWK